jgi:hypothetical protein
MTRKRLDISWRATEGSVQAVSRYRSIAKPLRDVGEDDDAGGAGSGCSSSCRPMAAGLRVGADRFRICRRIIRDRARADRNLPLYTPRKRIEAVLQGDPL